MHEIHPAEWKGVMHWLEHVNKGRTTTPAVLSGEAAPTESQHRDWRDLNSYASNTMDKISTCITFFGILNTIIMRE